ncbi:MAG: tRNA dihydrouridine synthase [Candidatus Gracilibacteria bacterium]
MNNFWKDLAKPMVALAPMDGYTDQAFRLLVRAIEPRAVVFTEFLSSDAIAHGAKPVLEALKLKKAESPLVVQIFGKDPEILAKAALYVQNAGADAVDVNMGCPAKKVVNSMHGSALMQNIDLACEIVSRMKATVRIPVSVKTRLGWEDDTKLIPFVQRLVDAGLDHITIHGRTYKQAFKGEAHWDAIYELKKAVPITVMGNGDIKSWQSTEEKIGNLDGVMIGRATFGNPWLVKEVADFLYDGKKWSSLEMSFEEKMPAIFTHLDAAWETKGFKGMLEMRKHLASYVRGVHGASTYRNQLVQISSPDEAKQILETILKEEQAAKEIATAAVMPEVI